MALITYHQTLITFVLFFSVMKQLYFIQRLSQVIQQISNMLRTDRQTHRSRLNALFFQLLFIQLRMCSGSRMDNERLNIRYICQK